MPRYLDPKADIIFKRIFGEHPKLLQNFLNAILPFSSQEQIVSLEYLPSEQVPQIPIFKRSIVDVKCTDSQGRIFIVEMQMEWTRGFMQRMLFGSAAAYVKQLHKGEDYNALCPVYGIGIINDRFDATAEWYHHYKIVNVQNPEKQLKGLELIFLELPKFKPSNREEKRLQALWIRFLSEIGETTKIIDADLLSVPEIEEACSLCEEAAYSDGELEVYSKYWDDVSTAKTLVSGHREEGRLEGRLEGRIEGRDEGLIEGEAKGRLEEKRELAKQLLAHGFTKEGIANLTQLSLSEIELLSPTKNSERAQSTLT